MYDVTPLVCARASAPKAQLFRNIGWAEQVNIASIAWLLRGPGGTILIDTSLGGAEADLAFSNTRASLDAWEICGGGILGRLDSLGLSPKDINTVILTHLHADHIASLPEFGSSRIVLSRTGWNQAHTTSHPWLNPYPREIISWLDARSDQLRLVPDEGETLDGISFQWVGGHSACSQVVILETKAGRTAFSGDLVPFAENWEKRIPTGHYQNLNEVAAAYEYLERFDAIVPGHDPEQPVWMEPAPL